MMTFIYIILGIGVLMTILLLLGRSKEAGIPQVLSDEKILQLAKRGKKIEAINCYRSLHNVGLKEAKDAVEDMLRHT